MIISRKILLGLTFSVIMVGIAIVNQPMHAAANGHQNQTEKSSVCTPITPYAEMTDAQKAEMKSRHATMLEWRKKDLKEAVAKGRITQQDADERIAKMQTMFKDMQEGKMSMHHGAGHSQAGSKADNRGEHRQHRQ